MRFFLIHTIRDLVVGQDIRRFCEIEGIAKKLSDTKVISVLVAIL